MVGRIAFRRFLRQCHRGLPWLLCIGGHRSATAQRTGRSVWLVDKWLRSVKQLLGCCDHVGQLRELTVLSRERFQLAPCCVK